MKKQDLKTGMQIEFSDGSRFVVMLDTLKGDVVCEIDGQSWAYLKDYTDDFVCDNDHFPVKAVYGNHFPNEFIFLKMDEEDLLWQREEKVELTMDEIAEKFNIPVKNIKIKK